MAVEGGVAEMATEAELAGAEGSAAEITIRAQIDFGEWSGMSFCRFLPLADSPEWVSMGGTRFEVAIVVDLHGQRRWVGDVEVASIHRHLNLGVSGLTILLRAVIAEAVGSDLRDDRTSDDTRRFGAEVLDALERVHDSVIAFARSDHKHYLLEPRRPSHMGLQQTLTGYDARFRTEQGWKGLRVERDPVTLSVEANEGIPRSDWMMLLEGLRRGGYRARSHRSLLANAWAHVARHDLRAAIVEAVAAWEMVLSGAALEHLAAASASFNAEDWKQVIEKAGLRASTRLFFGLIDFPAAREHRASVLEALNCRNNVVHNGQQKLERGQINEYLRAIGAVIAACEAATRSASEVALVATQNVAIADEG